MSFPRAIPVFKTLGKLGKSHHTTSNINNGDLKRDPTLPNRKNLEKLVGGSFLCFHRSRCYGRETREMLDDDDDVSRADGVGVSVHCKKERGR